MCRPKKLVGPELLPINLACYLLKITMLCLRLPWRSSAGRARTCTLVPAEEVASFTVDARKRGCRWVFSGHGRS
ncbi:unnamed protein product [Urochloa humidicola]